MASALKASVFLATLGMALTVDSGARPPLTKDTYEILSDVDITFLIGNPKTPWGPDLFRKSPGFAPIQPNTGKPKLQGIVYQGKNSTAFIDNKPRKTGDQVNTWRIAEIGTNFVVLDDGDSLIELVLPPTSRAPSERRDPANGKDAQ